MCPELNIKHNKLSKEASSRGIPRTKPNACSTCMCQEDLTNKPTVMQNIRQKKPNRNCLPEMSNSI